MRKLFLFLTALCFSATMFADGGIFEAYVTYGTNESAVSPKKVGDIDNQAPEVNLGTINKFQLDSFFVKVWQKDGDQFNKVSVNYKIDGGDLQAIEGAWKRDLSDSDREWGIKVDKDIVADLADGDHTLEVWFVGELTTPTTLRYLNNKDHSNYKFNFKKGTPEPKVTNWFVIGSFNEWASGYKLAGEDNAKKVKIAVDEKRNYEFKFIRVEDNDTTWYGLPSEGNVMKYGECTNWVAFKAIADQDKNNANVGLKTTKAGNYEFIVNVTNKYEGEIAPKFSVAIPVADGVATKTCTWNIENATYANPSVSKGSYGAFAEEQTVMLDGVIYLAKSIMRNNKNSSLDLAGDQVLQFKKAEGHFINKNSLQLISLELIVNDENVFEVAVGTTVEDLAAIDIAAEDVDVEVLDANGAEATKTFRKATVDLSGKNFVCVAANNSGTPHLFSAKLTYVDDGSAQQVTHVSSVTLDITEKTISAFDQLQLSATVAPDNADDKSVTWSSSNEAIATVDENGLVTALTAGNVDITVKSVDGEKTDVCKLTVAAAKRSDFVLINPANLQDNDTVIITMTVDSVGVPMLLNGAGATAVPGPKAFAGGVVENSIVPAKDNFVFVANVSDKGIQFVQKVIVGEGEEAVEKELILYVSGSGNDGVRVKEVNLKTEAGWDSIGHLWVVDEETHYLKSSYLTNDGEVVRLLGVNNGAFKAYKYSGTISSQIKEQTLQLFVKGAKVVPVENVAKWFVIGSFNNWESGFELTGEDNAKKVKVTVEAKKNYEFKLIRVEDNDTTWFGLAEAGHVMKYGECTDWIAYQTITDQDKNAANVGLLSTKAGDYEFTVDVTNKAGEEIAPKFSVAIPEPVISGDTWYIYIPFAPDDWRWHQMTEGEDGTWSYSDKWFGGGANVSTSIDINKAKYFKDEEIDFGENQKAPEQGIECTFIWNATLQVLSVKYEKSIIDENVTTVIFDYLDFVGQGVSGGGGAVRVEKNGVIFECDKAYGDGQYGVRCYKGSHVIISASENIVKIEFDFQTINGKYYNGGLDDFVCVGGEKWESGELGAQARMNQITVTLGEGTCEIPSLDTITVTQALEIAQALSPEKGTTATTSKKYVVKGYVVMISAKYENTFYLADEQGASGEFEAFKCKSIDSEVAEGDYVMVTGLIDHYWGEGSNGEYHSYEISGGVLEHVNPVIIVTPENAGVVRKTLVNTNEYRLEAVPNNNYHFVQWSDKVLDNPRTILVTQDTTFTAEFALNYYSVSVSSNDNTKGSVTGGGEYEYGSVAILTAIPETGFQFNRWSDGSVENPHYVSVLGNASYTAYFDTKMCKLAIKANDIMAGGVKGAGTFEYGEQVEISARANSGYQFVKWSNGETYNPYVFTIVDDMELVAFFQRTEADPVNVDEVVVTPDENSANIQWPQVDNAYTYTLIIWADAAQTEKICTLVFDASGRLQSINFNKKPRTSTAQTEQLSGFSFTVTGLDENTEYFYSLAAKDEHDNLIGEEEKGNFTTKGTATGIDEINSSNTQTVKLLKQGQLYILRNGEMYNAQGARVK